MKRNKQHRSHRGALHGSDSELMDVGTFFVMDQMEEDKFEPSGDAFAILENTVNESHTSAPHRNDKQHVNSGTRVHFADIEKPIIKGVKLIGTGLTKGGELVYEALPSKETVMTKGKEALDKTMKMADEGIMKAKETTVYKSLPDKKKVVKTTKKIYGKVVDMGAKGVKSIKGLLTKRSK